MPILHTITRWQDAEPASLAGHVVAVIDVLRWSTVVITALGNGAEWVEACATPEEALARGEALGRARCIVGGERGNVALPGFDVGNSPLEYGAERVGGRTVITTTTNGTQALLAAREAHEALVAAFVNLDAVVAHLRAAHAAARPVTLLCAGQAGEEALEDSACAGAIAEALLANGTPAAKPDAGTQRAIEQWVRHGRDPRRVFAAAPHGRALAEAGFTADIAFAARASSSQRVARRTARGLE